MASSSVETIVAVLLENSIASPRDVISARHLPEARSRSIKAGSSNSAQSHSTTMSKLVDSSIHSTMHVAPCCEMPSNKTTSIAFECSLHVRSPKSASKSLRNLRLGCFPRPEISQRVNERKRVFRFVGDNRGCRFFIQGPRMSIGRER